MNTRLQYLCRSCGQKFTPMSPTDHLCVACQTGRIVVGYWLYVAAGGVIMGAIIWKGLGL